MVYYKFLEENLNNYINLLPNTRKEDYNGLIVGHGDKCSQYVDGIDLPEAHIRLLHIQTYIFPYCEEVRNTDNGWVSVDEWIVNNHQRFLPYLEQALNNV